MKNEIAQKPLNDLAAEINREHLLAEGAARSMAEHARQAGLKLIEAKSRCGHGEWKSWLQENFEGSVRRAQVYMKLAREWPTIEAKAQRAALLTVREAVGLLADSTPKPAINRLDLIRESGRPKTGRLPKPGRLLVGEASESYVCVESTEDPDFFYLTVHEPEDQETGREPASFMNKAVHRSGVYLSLQILMPEQDLDEIKWWAEVEWPCREVGYHEMHKPYRLYPDYGNRKLNQLEEVIYKRVKFDEDEVVGAVRRIAERELYIDFSPTLQSYLKARFNMFDEEANALIELAQTPPAAS